MEFTEEILEKTFAEMLGKECFSKHLGNTIVRKPEIKELNGGIEVAIFAYKQTDTSKTLRNDFGKTSERLRKEFGSISERILIEPLRNIEFIQSNYEGFIAYLNDNFGITSEKLRKSFGKRFIQAD